jgi:hypothetical protein
LINGKYDVVNLNETGPGAPVVEKIVADGEEGFQARGDQSGYLGHSSEDGATTISVDVNNVELYTVDEGPNSNCTFRYGINRLGPIYYWFVTGFYS